MKFHNQTSFLLLLFFVVFFSAQSVSDYQFIIIPKKFKDFKENQYELNSMLSNALKAKKYTILSENQESWPAEVRQNPCLALRADAENESSMLRNKLELQLIDCKNSTILEVKESSMIKDYEEGFQEALKKSLVKILPSNPVFPTEIMAQIATPIKENIETSVSTTTSNTNTSVASNTSSKVESYTNGSINYQKINIGNGQFILVTSTSSAPFATFSNSTKADVYRVILQNGSTTLGYLENGNIVVEMPNADGSFRKEVFGRK